MFIHRSALLSDFGRRKMKNIQMERPCERGLKLISNTPESCICPLTQVQSLLSDTKAVLFYFFL
ncbi:hypothetical protein AB205_0037120 [Aquarana catesbeiana]|uniref:Uncharacterized protein n=1 Tax=Aquarana catesbeiana TaxID=8400 RepID=A0A2G9SAI3_AQUCT|nr:hypothetical protein AB205_0037120 [Aquarana catesbeiana]